LSGPVLTVLLAISFAHLLNDTIQAVFPAIYPLLKQGGDLGLDPWRGALCPPLAACRSGLGGVLSVPIGIILASAFSAILVYAQELIPGKVGLVAGLFFGLAFGMGGIASAVLGVVADHTSIEFVFLICSFLPLIGGLTYFLPDVRQR
jgi:hypothetical protein